MKIRNILIAGAMIASMVATTVSAAGGMTRLKGGTSRVQSTLDQTATTGILALTGFNFRQCIDQNANYINNEGALFSAWMFMPLMGSCNGLDDIMYEAQDGYCSGSHGPAQYEWRSRPGLYNLSPGQSIGGEDDVKYTVWYGIGRCWSKREVDYGGDPVTCGNSDFGDPKRAYLSIEAK